MSNTTTIKQLVKILTNTIACQASLEVM